MSWENCLYKGNRHLVTSPHVSEIAPVAGFNFGTISDNNSNDDLFDKAA